MARGRNGGNRSGPPPRQEQVSKQLSWLLRHGAEQEGLQLGEGGFASARDVLQNGKLKSLGVTFEEMREIVAENDKQRFTLRPVSATTAPGDDVERGEADVMESGIVQPTVPSHNAKDWLIRANQGHSIKVESEGLLTPITAENVPATAVHGTSHAAWPLIVAAGGLKTMGRTHVHFASGLPAGFAALRSGSKASEGESAPVISGMRKTSSVLVYVDVRKAMDAGIKFWLSDNGVILSEGNEEGALPMEYFRRVEDQTGEGVLVEDGVVVKDAPVAWVRKGTGRGGGRGGRNGRGRGRGS